MDGIGDNVVQMVEDLMVPACQRFGVELYDVEYMPYAGNNVLRIYIDKPTGVDIEDCALVSRYAEELLDANDFIAEKYLLEVSSPGIDRKLNRFFHYANSIGQTVKMKLREPINGCKKIEAILISVDESTNKIEINYRGASIDIQRENILECRVVPDFKIKYKGDKK